MICAHRACGFGGCNDILAETEPYINANSIGMNDGMDFVEESLNPEECRQIFEMIFDAMNQRQHYDMMLRLK